MKNRTLAALAALICFAWAGAAAAAPLVFDFKDPKGVNSASFRMDATLEAISGTANGITGMVTFDPDNPGATTGSITVTTASMHVPNPTMDGHMHTPAWLDAAKYPEIKFVETSLENVKTTDNSTTADAHGALTIKGITKDVTVPVKLSYYKDRLSERIPNVAGDVLMLRARFTISRSDFGIQAHQKESVVSDEIEINLDLAGACKHD